MYSTRSSSGVFQAFYFVANIPATHTAEITAAIPITAIAIHRSLLLVFFRLFLLFPFFILTSIHFALLFWSYSIFYVRYIFIILLSYDFEVKKFLFAGYIVLCIPPSFYYMRKICNKKISSAILLHLCKYYISKI